MPRNGGLNAAIGVRVAGLIESRSLSYRDIERLTGRVVYASNLTHLLCDEADWLPKHLEAVATALGVHPRELLPGPEDGPTGARTPNPPPLALSDAEAALVLAVRAGNLRLVGHYVAELAPEPPAPRKPSPP